MATGLFSIGCDHRAVPPSRLGEAGGGDADAIAAQLVAARRDGRIEGAVWLSTCNRIELVLDLPAAAEEDSVSARGEELASHLLGTSLPWNRASGRAVVDRLLRIATGLESMVLGEEQILGQVSRAFKRAEDFGLLSRSLHMLRSRVLSSARQLRADVPCAGPVSSVAALGVRRVAAAGPRIGVLGAGETARLVLDALRRRRSPAVLVINRTESRAAALAGHYGCESTSLAAFRSAPIQLDGLVCAADAEAPLVAAEHLVGLRCVVDLSRPSVCAPDVREVPGLDFVDLDLLGASVEAQTAAQSRAAEQLAAQLSTKADWIWDQVRPGRAQLGRVVDLHVESAMAEAEQALRSKLDHLGDREREEVRELVRRLAKRHAHYHLLDLKQLGVR